MFVRTKGLVLLALGLMTLLVTMGGVSIWADISGERENIRAVDELVAGLTPVGCIHEYVSAYIEEDDVLLRALHADKSLEFTFDYSREDAYPVAVIWPLHENENAASLETGRVVYLAVLEIEYEDGTRTQLECEFEFTRESDGRWQITNKGF